MPPFRGTSPYVRLVSGALLLALSVSALWLLPPFVLLGMAVLIALLAFREYADIASRAGSHVSRPAGAAAVALVCVTAGMPGLPLEAALAFATLGLATLAVAGATKATAGREAAGALQMAAISTFAPLYIGLPLGLLSATRWTLGKEAALLLVLTVAASDTFQYYSGRLMGRHPLAPSVSPKKTVEGAVGGFAGAALSLAVIGHWWLPQMALPVRIVLGLLIAAVGIIGDLFESVLKRGVGMKDASALIPGHGGVLDRIDALLFAAPVYYVFVRYTF